MHAPRTWIAREIRKRNDQAPAGRRLAKVGCRCLIIAGVSYGLLFAAAAQVTAIRAGKLIDPDSGSVLSSQTILIRDGKIEAVGNNLTIPSDAKVVDPAR